MEDGAPLKLWSPRIYDTSNLMAPKAGAGGLGDPMPVGASNSNVENANTGTKGDGGSDAAVEGDDDDENLSVEELREKIEATADAAAAAGEQAAAGAAAARLAACSDPITAPGPDSLVCNAAKSAKSTGAALCDANPDKDACLQLLDSAISTACVIPAYCAAAPTNSGSDIVVIVAIVAVVLLAAIGILVWVVCRKKTGFVAGASGAKYENAAYAPGNRPGAATSGAPAAGAGLPSWADPNVPFLSRSEAEGQLKQQGLTDGAYVVRQTVNTVAGYVVTATHSGKFANIQLKNNGGQLYYGAKSVGPNLQTAIAALQTSVQVAAGGIMPFHLQSGPAGGYVADMDA